VHDERAQHHELVADPLLKRLCEPLHAFDEQRPHRIIRRPFLRYAAARAGAF
jgi:hypothetical protein